jgi:ParB family chromosome partitioning protein
MSKKRGLGKGLGAMGVSELLSELASSTQAKNSDIHLTSLSISKLQAGKLQPRQEFATEELESLAESIQQQGIIQPLVVRPHGDKYEIIAGERRFRAAQLAGLEQVPCVVRALDDKTALAMALIENIQREDLNAIEQAQAFKKLMDTFSLSQDECARQLGKSRSGVANFLRLLQLDIRVQTMLRERAISMGHARALLPLAAEQQVMIARRVCEKALSVRQTEEWVKWLQTPRTKANHEPLSVEVLGMQKNLASKLSAKVKIQHNAEGKGKMVIHFKDNEHLASIIAKI